MDNVMTNVMDTGAQVQARSGAALGIRRGNHFRVDCTRAGQPLWTEEFDNLVVTVGLTDSLDKHLKGSNYSAAWFIGLLSATPTIIAANDMGTHAGWTEVTAYDETYRQTLTLGTVTAGSVDNVASKAVFTISGTVTVGGVFIASSHTKSETASILYGAGAFATGDRAVLDNDVLTVTVTCTATAT
jgi:hypothetical protein